MNRKYELVIIVNAALSTEEKESICKQTTETVVKGGGKVINSQLWLDKYRMTFPLKKCSEGSYYLFSFEGESLSLPPLRETLKQNENILRSAIMAVQQKN